MLSHGWQQGRSGIVESHGTGEKKKIKINKKNFRAVLAFIYLTEESRSVGCQCSLPGGIKMQVCSREM